MKDWEEIEKAAAELWCQAKWCDRKARPLKWSLLNELRNRYERGDRSPDTARGYRDYHALNDFSRGKRGKDGRAGWLCLPHTVEIETYDGLKCTVDGCPKIVGRRPARGYCHAHYQHWAKHGTTEYIGLTGKLLSVEPVYRLFEQRGGFGAVCADERKRDRWSSYLRENPQGIPLSKADELAVTVLQTHPSIIWGDDWWDKTAMESEVEYA